MMYNIFELAKINITMHMDFEMIFGSIFPRKASPLQGNSHRPPAEIVSSCSVVPPCPPFAGGLRGQSF